jgi:hypothetical protein
MRCLAFLAIIALASGCMCCGGFDDATAVTSEAIQKKDPNACSKLESDFWRISCCAGTGMQLNESAICDGVADQECKDYCYNGVASSRNDKDICDKIQTTSIRNGCLGETGEN